MTKKIVIGFIVAIVIILFLRFSTPEDTWLCQKGEWVKHGRPSAPQPTAICQ
ncbi:MAG: hypothetical protein NTY75_02975 [Candidatus Shapirobacteria bacterium]|nr:hypothetical protein [Candidatus Shapirobacteria bacterium]